MVLTNKLLVADEPTRQVRPSVITLFFQQYFAQELAEGLEKMKKPGRIHRMIFKEQLRSTLQQGIYAAYAGFCTRSDPNGQIVFPREHQGDEITYVVTQRIKPVLVNDATVRYFVLAESAAAEYYKLTRQFDPQKKVYYWRVKKIATPTNRRIPVMGITIFAKPQHLIIQEGDFITEGGANFILPDIWVTKYNTASVNALVFLKNSKYFAPVNKEYRYADERYATLINPYSS